MAGASPVCRRRRGARRDGGPPQPPTHGVVAVDAQPMESDVACPYVEAEGLAVSLRKFATKVVAFLQWALIVVVCLAIVSCFYALDKFRWTL
jgi:hypothetical protein